MRVKSLLLRPNERYHRRSSYTSICRSLSLSLAHVSCLSVCGGCTSCGEGCAQMLHGANGLGVAGEIRKGPCARNTLPVRARYTPRLYVSMTGKALHRLTTRRHRNANFPWRGVREPGPKRKVFVGFAFWRLRHQRTPRDRESGFSQSSNGTITGRTASLKFMRDIFF